MLDVLHGGGSFGSGFAGITESRQRLGKRQNPQTAAASAHGLYARGATEAFAGACPTTKLRSQCLSGHAPVRQNGARKYRIPYRRRGTADRGGGTASRARFGFR